jgi:fructosamine-3-kinase
VDGDLQRLARVVGSPVRRVRPVGGGCIAGASMVETDRGRLFLKWGRGDIARALEAEADGLATLRSASGVSGLGVPEVVVHAAEDDGEPALLVLEWIDQVPWTDRLREHLGRGFAALHAVTRPGYGYGRDNFIGRLPQENGELDDWPAFYRSRRLEPQARRAREGGAWDPAWDRPYSALSRSLDERLPRRPAPSVLHGDLWSGNVMASAGGPVLIDPAVYAGDRETDLAMARLFGGFGARFFAAYEEAWPLEAGWRSREPTYRLYHLLNHLNHFGPGYAPAVGRALRGET